MNTVNQETMQFINDTIVNYPYKKQPFSIGKDWNEMSFKEALSANSEYKKVLSELIKPAVDVSYYNSICYLGNSKPAMFNVDVLAARFSENVRTVTFIHLYNTCISEHYGDVKLTLRNNTKCSLAEFIEVLFELRKRNKLLHRTRAFQHLKGVVNSLFMGLSDVINNYDPCKVVDLGRSKIEALANHIDSNGGVVLQINVDGIIYVSEKVLVPDGLHYHADVLDWFIPLPDNRSIYSSHGVIKTSRILDVDAKRLERIRKADHFKKYLESNHGI